MVQAERMLDLKVAPALGASRVIFVAAIVIFHAPVVVTVSVPPELSVHPLMEGGADSGRVDLALVTVPLAEKLVHETVIGIESMSPLKVIAVPDLSEPVTVVPFGSEA